MLKKILFVICLVPCSIALQAKTICNATSLKRIYVEAERPSDTKYSNMFLIQLDESCAGKGYAYIENDAKAYDGILSLALMAYASDKKLIVVVDENTFIGNASRIEYIYPE